MIPIIGAPQFADGDPGYASIFFGTKQNLSKLKLSLIPRDPPIVIPKSGGRFRYDLDLQNGSNVTRRIDVWIKITGPGIDRIVERFSRTLAPGERFHRAFRQRVSGDVTAGTYYWECW